MSVPDFSAGGQLRVIDLGPAARFIRLGRVGLDLLASFLFAPLGLLALFFTMFAFVFGLCLTLLPLLRLAGSHNGVEFMNDLAGETSGLSYPAFIAFITGMVLSLAAIAAAVTAARAPRVWGIAATLVIAIFVALLMPDPFQKLTGDDEAVITWTQFALLCLLRYGVLAAALLAASLLLAGIIARRRSPVGRIVQRWPRFSIPIFAARYGFGAGDFWRPLLRTLGRLLLAVFGISILFVGLIFVLLALSAGALALLGVPANDWHPLFFLTDIMLWLAVMATAARAAWRMPATRLVDGVVAAFALFAAAELAWDFHDALKMTGPLKVLGAFFSPVSEDELELLNAAAMVWLFRSLVSRVLVTAYSGLKRTTARTASELAGKRPEPPILFLRSFMDDEQLVPSSDILLAYAFGAHRDRVRLEEIVAEIMFARGPLVALANPSVPSAPLGAARDVTADVDWQDKVTAFLNASQIVICFLGKTKSFLWEIDRILLHGKLDSTLIVLPPTYPHDRQLVHDAPKLAHLLGLSDEADERARLKGVRVLVHDAVAGDFCAVRSPSADSFSYREAILIAAATILRNAELRAGAGAAG